MPPHRTGNHLLDSLPEADFNRLRPHLKDIDLVWRDTLHHAGLGIESACFPTAGVLSAVAPLEDGSAVEIGMIGTEGVVGLSATFGAAASPYDVVVQGIGTALCTSTTVVRQELDHSPSFRKALLRYTEFWLEEVSQTAACNAHHGMEPRCARWLLTMRDRVRADSFPITQEFLAKLLGVRRPGVTTVAGALQRRGVIRYTHGQLTILDPGGLEAVSCECHRLFTGRLDGLMVAYAD